MDKLFDTKRRYIGYDGEEYINMCIPVLDISKLFGNGVSTLTKDENGRLDTFVWKNVEKDFPAVNPEGEDEEIELEQEVSNETEREEDNSHG